jgi:hypothetical protein
MSLSLSVQTMMLVPFSSTQQARSTRVGYVDVDLLPVVKARSDVFHEGVHLRQAVLGHPQGSTKKASAGGLQGAPRAGRDDGADGECVRRSARVRKP